MTSTAKDWSEKSTERKRAKSIRIILGKKKGDNLNQRPGEKCDQESNNIPFDNHLGSTCLFWITCRKDIKISRNHHRNSGNNRHRKEKNIRNISQQKEECVFSSRNRWSIFATLNKRIKTIEPKHKVSFSHISCIALSKNRENWKKQKDEKRKKYTHKEKIHCYITL